ncbi:hypothetical protein [Streptantibioticus ferralitis]|uniref:Uncharacterized protein n=1 Tax=Streptantibioticus ferralitis TaxID=236510 RepID=A0ABT5Z024_9ACTN|nr:hypothetical protein [Streptantibioticus ferralitis]MDF2257185.1 hypothetical protein [Streptantibioticus ferralitis]
MVHNDSAGHHVRLRVDGQTTIIEIDGECIDPRGLRGYTISQVPGEPAHLVLHLADSGDTNFDGLARVSVADVTDPGPAVAEFLAAIDPDELERAALTRPDLGAGPGSLTRAMLAQLGEWACGA